MSTMLSILQRSLGLNEYGEGRAFRNNFVAGGDDTIRICRVAVALGYMVEKPASELTGGDPLFIVTATGREFISATSPVRPPVPKLSRSQVRYRRFLEYGDGFDSFLAFCRWDSLPERSWI